MSSPTLPTLIVKAGRSDSAGVLDLMGQLYDIEHMAFDSSRALAALHGLLDHPERGSVFLARQRDETLGYAVVTRAYSLEFGGVFALLDELFVMPSARGAGLGGALVRAVIEDCRAAGIPTLRLEVERANDRAQALYRRFGFTRHSRDLMTCPVMM
ncbi:MAG: GNAT family N-acetyltransferase [Acidobacteria bacterium]|nr:GNAT family N-acetyltransferase [Acidobacteriota bacterium]